MYNDELSEKASELADDTDVEKEMANAETHYRNSTVYVRRDLDVFDHMERERLERKIEIYNVASDPTVLGIAVCLLRPGGIRDSLEVTIPVLEKLSDKIRTYRRKKLIDKCVDLTLKVNAASGLVANLHNDEATNI